MSTLLFPKNKISPQQTIGGISNIIPRINTNGIVGTEIKLISFGNSEDIAPEADVLFQFEQAAEIAKRHRYSLLIDIIIVGLKSPAILASQALSMSDHLSISSNPESLLAPINRIAIGKSDFLTRIHKISTKFSDSKNIHIQTRSIETQAINYEAISISTLADKERDIAEWFIAPNHIGISPWNSAAQKAEDEIAVQIDSDFNILWLQSEPVSISDIPSPTVISKQIRGSIQW